MNSSLHKQNDLLTKKLGYKIYTLQLYRYMLDCKCPYFFKNKLS